MSKKEVVTNNLMTAEYVLKQNETSSKTSGDGLLINENMSDLINKDYLDVLYYVRDRVHNNYKLLTHPLASNFLPDKTMYKSIIIEAGDKLDYSSVGLIEDAIILANEALKSRSPLLMEEHILEDLRYVDFQVIRHSVDRLYK